MIRALLVDDEENNLLNLEIMLQEYCEGVKVIGKVLSTEQAGKWLESYNVDVIFLDIAIPGEDVFEFLKTQRLQNIKIVFVTAHQDYALQAIKANALDYILKPIDINELRNAVSKAKHLLNDPQEELQSRLLIEHLLKTTVGNASPQKMALPQFGGICYIDVDDIVSLEADSNYTVIYLKNTPKLVISKTLKDFQDLLDESQFARVHKSYLINLKYVKEYSTQDGGFVKMSDGNSWSISRTQLSTFLEKMKTASLTFRK